MADEPSTTPQEQEAPANVPTSESDWRSGISAELRDDPIVRETKSLDALVTRLRDAQGALGRSVKIPGEGEILDPESLSKLQRHVPNLAVIPEGEDRGEYLARQRGWAGEETAYEASVQGLTDNDMALMRTMAHEARMAPDDFQRAAQALGAHLETTQSQRMQAHSEDRLALRTEWGAAYDQKTAMAARGKVLAQEMGLDLGHLELDSLTSNEVKFLSNLADRFGPEGQTLVDETYEARRQPTPQEAQDQIDAIMGDPEHPYNVYNHPSHRRAVDEMMSLTRQLLGEKADDNALDSLNVGVGQR